MSAEYGAICFYMGEEKEGAVNIFFCAPDSLYTHSEELMTDRESSLSLVWRVGEK